ncbi:unnamed protein product, partial [Medioppia subpectinata]
MNGTAKSHLFSSLTIRGQTLKNRICVPALCQYSATDGLANDWHLVNAGSFARGGAALVVMEATGVEPRGRITHQCLGLWCDQQIEPLARIVRFVKSQGAVAGIQLSHAGRKGSNLPPTVGRGSIPDSEGGWPTIGPSAIAFGANMDKVPKEATVEDIHCITGAFVSSALRAVKAGFQVIELHLAHGYLISTFLSPISNHRTDRYGGCLENRMRFGLEMAESVRNSLPDDIVLGAKVSVTDYADNGWDLKQTLEFAKRLKALGVDYITASSGGVVSGVEYKQTAKVHLNAAQSLVEEVGVTAGVV